MCEHGQVNARRSPGLTVDDLESLSAGLAAGKRVTVYLRDAMPSLDLAPGASARVISIDGQTVTVSPKGVDDQLPFEADELVRSRSTAAAAPAKARAAKSTRAAASSVSPSLPTSPAGEAKSSGTSSPTPPPTPRSTPAPAAPKAAMQPSGPNATKAVPAAKPTRRPKSGAAPVSVTITSVDPTTWTVTVAHGAKRQGAPTQVNADRVARAVRELGHEGAITAVDGVIESARAAAQKRIEELSHELESARAALATLDGSTEL